MKDLDVFRAALTRGKAIPAWQLAYLLARLSPPSPTHDPPITIPTDERPPLVIAALRWVSERAAEEPCSDEDEGRRQRDWVEYFVRPEVALSMLDEASQEANVWLAMPHVRVIDAAVLVARDVPQAGIHYAEELTPAQLAAGRLIQEETGVAMPSRWMPPDGTEAWITSSQLLRLLKLTKVPVEPIQPSRPRVEPRFEAIREAAKKLDIDLQFLKPQEVGRPGEKATIKKAALADQASAFGVGNQAEAFDRAWVSMKKDGQIKHRP